MEKYDKYGNVQGKVLDDIKQGDLVQFTTTKSELFGKIRKNVKVNLSGIWDGEKVQFNDNENTIVRSLNWLTKVKNCPLCGHDL